jgi:hypothetical protein
MSVYVKDEQQENKRRKEHKAKTDEVRRVAGDTQTRPKRGLERRDGNAE